MFKTILVPTDGSPRSEKAVNAAVKFAKENNSKIIGISIAEPHPSPLLSDSEFFGATHKVDKDAHDLALEHVQKVAEAAVAEGVPSETVFIHSFNPHEEILKTAEKYHCDLVFMAPYGKKGWTGVFLDSETQKVVMNATIPVLVFH
jgi:nucleotide-binding universal stress UspA family protein